MGLLSSQKPTIWVQTPIGTSVSDPKFSRFSDSILGLKHTFSAKLTMAAIVWQIGAKVILYHSSNPQLTYFESNQVRWPKYWTWLLASTKICTGNESCKPYHSRSKSFYSVTQRWVVIFAQLLLLQSTIVSFIVNYVSDMYTQIVGLCNMNIPTLFKL